MKIVLVSGHKKNWGAGASTVYLHLEKELQKLSCQSHLFNYEDYFTDNIPNYLKKFLHSFHVKNRILAEAQEADVVEVAGGIGWWGFSTNVNVYRNFGRLDQQIHHRITNRLIKSLSQSFHSRVS